MLYLTNINLSGNELQNAVIQPLAAPPQSPKLGQIYCDSTNYRIKWYNGSAWQVVGVVVESSEANGSIKVDGVEMTVYTLPAATASTLGGIKVGTGLKVSADGTLSVSVVNNLTSDDTTSALSAAQGKLLKDSIDAINTNLGEMGGGDMMKSAYDTNNSGIVDDAEKLGGQLPEYYAKATDIPTKVSDLDNDSKYLTSFTESDPTVPAWAKNATKPEYTAEEVGADTEGSAAQALADSKSYTDTKVAEVVNSAPELLDTLGELSKALGDDPNFAATTAEQIGKKANTADLAAVATSGEYSDLKNAPARLESKTLTLVAGQTSVAMAEPNFLGYVCAYNASTGEGLLCDWEYTEGSLKVDINSAQSYNITIIYNVLVQ